MFVMQMDEHGTILFNIGHRSHGRTMRSYEHRFDLRTQEHLFHHIIEHPVGYLFAVVLWSLPGVTILLAPYRLRSCGPGQAKTVWSWSFSWLLCWS